MDNTEKSERKEFVEDLVQIITVFSCKLQGKRANIAKKLMKKAANSFRIQNSEKNLQGLDILRNTHGY